MGCTPYVFGQEGSYRGEMTWQRMIGLKKVSPHLIRGAPFTLM
ncbi:hypothetical protein HanPSC8_Chr15g0657621 [Helianthus annuus]|nr:hypothetical protein HanPSC8_Chr15g0657621 [Helianthus annuus]